MWPFLTILPRFSIGIEDVTPGAGLIAEKEKLLNTGYSTCDTFIEDFKLGTVAVLKVKQRIVFSDFIGDVLLRLMKLCSRVEVNQAYFSGTFI